jgi:TPR repeat protein
MSQRYMKLWAFLAMTACWGCDKQQASISQPTPAAAANRAAAAQTKSLTDVACLIWLDLVTVWHLERKNDRLVSQAKIGGWKELSPDQLDLLGAKRGYEFRVNEIAVLVSGDDEGGIYSVVVATILDDVAIIRQLGQAFDIRQIADLTEAGMRSRLYSLITRGAPVGIATVDSSIVESSPTTRIGFVSFARLRQAGLKVPSELAELSALIDRAKNGDAVAQVELGDAYFMGTFCRADAALAIDYWRMAAKQKSPRGYHRMALAYYAGIGVEKNMFAATDLFEKAAIAGDAEGQAMMGWMYSTGDGVQRDPTVAVNWLQRAVAQGHAGALNNLAVLYEKGDGVAIDQGRALELYRASAAKGYGLANVNLGKAYALGRGVSVDRLSAVKYFQIAADMGIMEGEYNLAVLYMEGSGVPRDVAKAADLYERAAIKGHSGAQNNLGLLLVKGVGRVQDLVEGAKWWIIASKAGSADAAANLPQIRTMLSKTAWQEAELRAAEFTPTSSLAADLLPRKPDR